MGIKKKIYEPIFCIICGKELSRSQCYNKHSQKCCSQKCDNIRRKKENIIFGCANNDYLEPVFIDGAVIQSYKNWYQMLRRCYDEKYHIHHPTYIDCYVCDEWKYFSKFKDWFDENYVEGYELDKDILIQGNKVYSPETCCFVPRHINTLMSMSGIKKSNVGTTLMKNKYISRCVVNGKSKNLGMYYSAEEAHEVYKKEKYAEIKRVAELCFNNGEIKQNLYDAMLNFII